MTTLPVHDHLHERPGSRNGVRRWIAMLLRLVVGALRLLVGALGLVVVTAGPALADPPGPTSYESAVVEISPDVPGVQVQVLGGDSFLQVANDGHEVTVPGYDGEEAYLRFDPDGTVWVNQRSATYWQNSDRYAVTPVPPGAGPEAPPQWVQVSDDGTWAWHDHRIHWMSPQTLPGDVDPSVASAQPALQWPVAIVVDGRDVTVTGTLTWLPSASPLPTILAAVAIALLAWALHRRTALAVVAVAAIAVVATGVVGVAATTGLAPGVQAEPLPLVLTVVTVVVATAGLAMRRRALGLSVAGAAGIPLVVWAVSQVAAVTAPVVPPDHLAAIVTRLAVGVAAGGGVAIVVLGVFDLFTRPLESREQGGSQVQGA